MIVEIYLPMLRDERGLSTLIGLVLIGLMLAGMAVGIQSIKNPAILRSRASDALNLVNQKSLEPSPTAIPQQIDPLIDLPENCDPDRTVCFSASEARLTVYQGAYEETTSTGAKYYIAPAFHLTKNGGSQDFKLVLEFLSGNGEGVELSPSEGNIKDGNVNVNLRVRSDSSAVVDKGINARVKLLVKNPGRPGYIDTNYILPLIVNIQEAPEGN